MLGRGFQFGFGAAALGIVACGGGSDPQPDVPPLVIEHVDGAGLQATLTLPAETVSIQLTNPQPQQALRAITV
jgi:hypothetical protein